MSYTLLIFVAWIAADLFWWRWADLRLRGLRGQIVLRALLAAFMVGQIAYMSWFLADAAQSRVPSGGPISIHIAGYLWHCIGLPAAIAIVGLGALRRRWKRQSIPRQDITRAISSPIFSPAVAHPSRRDLLGLAAAATPPLLAAGLTGFSIARAGDFRVDRVELPVPGLPADLDGLTIAHVTDLHIGKFLPPDVPARVAEATNRLHADLVVFTGDLIDVGTLGNLPIGINFLRQLDPGHGLVVIEGNHDLMADATEFEHSMLDAKMPLLLDDTKTVRIPQRATPVQFLGLTWGEWKRGSEMGKTGNDADRLFRKRSKEAAAESVAAVAHMRDPGAFPILLSHHPHAFDPAAAAGFPLILAGHTHGGQIMLTEHLGAGPIRFRYWSGVYAKRRSRLFISNGIGYWFPLRINAPAQVVHLTLRQA